MTQLMNIVRNALVYVREWQEFRSARAALMSMDDDLLRDIGLTRAEIDMAVRGGLVRPSAQIIALKDFQPSQHDDGQQELPFAA